MPSIVDFIVAAPFAIVIVGGICWFESWWKNRCIRKTVDDVMMDIKANSENERYK